MPIPTELVGSLPRPMKLQEAYEAYDQGDITFEDLQAEQDEAAADSIKRFERVGEPIVTAGEQRESSFATYPITDTLAGTGLADNLAGDGQFFAIFDDGHHRQLPRLTGGPFRYKTFASEFVEKNARIATHPVKQAVIAPSILALLYPLDSEIPGYSREQFEEDLVSECEKDIRQAFAAGAARVSVDRPSLDDVFMSYTGSTIRDAEEDQSKHRNRVMMQMMTGGRRGAPPPTHEPEPPRAPARGRGPGPRSFASRSRSAACARSCARSRSSGAAS